MSAFNQFNFGGVPENNSSSKCFENGEGDNIAKETQLCRTEELGDVNLFCSVHLGFSEDNTGEEGFLLSKYQQEPKLQLFPHCGHSGDLYLDMVSPPFQFSQEEITKLLSIQSENSELMEPQKAKPYNFPSASLGILKNYGSRSRQLNGKKGNMRSYYTTMTCTEVCGQKLSTDAIIRLAGENFIQSCSQRLDDLSHVSHPFACSLLGLSDEQTRDAELVQYVLASAEKLGQLQFDSASKLINQCDELSSDKGNPVQRLVYYFSEALREKIDRETGRITPKGLGKHQSFDLEEALMSASLSIISFHQKVPLSPVSQFTAMQIIVENVAEAKKVHIIDLEIRNGMQFTVLMQSLAARCRCPVEHLKITAVGTKSKPKIEETGKRLMSFAESIDLPFSFNVVMVADMLDLNEDLFELDAEEVVAVYSPCLLSTMIGRPDRLESLMKVIKKTNPCVMVVSEVEANNNSPVFVNRFIEALFLYGAFFDSLEDCMDRHDPNRMLSESKYFSRVIRNIVAAEGDERTVRHVNIDVWRAFFKRFGMEEIELSLSSLYQASLVATKFACGSSCTLELNGNCLLVGWKRTPIFSLSAWKFHPEVEG